MLNVFKLKIKTPLTLFLSLMLTLQMTVIYIYLEGGHTNKILRHVHEKLLKYL